MKNYSIEKIVPPPEEIIAKYPIDSEVRNDIINHVDSIKNILSGKDDRKILVIGPCSAWPDTAVIEYAKKLKDISNKVSDKIKIVLRVYTQKPRTTIGWTGPVNQPEPTKTADIEKGIIYCRKMMIEVAKLGFPIADEALFTHNEGYFSDLLSYQVIGARSSEDQEHRIYASMHNTPFGMKNPTSGEMKIAYNSIISAQNFHVFLLSGKQIKSKGNSFAHLVLRGINGKSNIFHDDLIEVISSIKTMKNPAIICDISHDNSIDPSTGKKDPLLQGRALSGLLHNMESSSQIKKYVKGFMIESFIKTGKQDIGDEMDLEGLSITDACIGLDETEKLIMDLYEKL